MNARKWDDLPGPYLAALDGMTCTHGVNRGARYCPLCRRLLEADTTGRPRPRFEPPADYPPTPAEEAGMSGYPLYVYESELLREKWATR